MVLLVNTLRLQLMSAPVRQLQEYVQECQHVLRLPEDTKLLGGRHDVIPSENAEAKHEYTLQIPAQGDFCCV